MLSKLTFLLFQFMKLKNSGMQKHSRAKFCTHTFFFHPDYTVGFGLTPNHALRLAGYTAGRDFHPALKIKFYYILAAILLLVNVK